MEELIKNNIQQPDQTVKGEYNGWHYEIDASYERLFLSYLSLYSNASTIGHGKNGVPEAFKHLHSLECPASVKTIAPFAFAGCKKLQFIKFDGCELIAKNAFWKCQNLTYAHFPKAKVIQAFSFCEAGTASTSFILYTPEVTSIESKSFLNCGAQVLYFQSLSNLGAKTIVRCPNLEQISVPSALTIEDGAIIENQKLESVYAPSLKYFSEEQVDNYNCLNKFVVSQQAKQAILRNGNDYKNINCFISINEYQKNAGKPKRS